MKHFETAVIHIICAPRIQHDIFRIRFVKTRLIGYLRLKVINLASPTVSNGMVFIENFRFAMKHSLRDLTAFLLVCERLLSKKMSMCGVMLASKYESAQKKFLHEHPWLGKDFFQSDSGYICKVLECLMRNGNIMDFYEGSPVWKNSEHRWYFNYAYYGTFDKLLAHICRYGTFPDCVDLVEELFLFKNLDLAGAALALEKNSTKQACPEHIRRFLK